MGQEEVPPGEGMGVLVGHRAGIGGLADVSDDQVRLYLRSPLNELGVLPGGPAPLLQPHFPLHPEEAPSIGVEAPLARIGLFSVPGQPVEAPRCLQELIAYGPRGLADYANHPAHGYTTTGAFRRPTTASPPRGIQVLSTWGQTRRMADSSEDRYSRAPHTPTERGRRRMRSVSPIISPRRAISTVKGPLRRRPG